MIQSTQRRRVKRHSNSALTLAAKRRLREVTLRKRREMGLDQDRMPTRLGDLLKIVLANLGITQQD